MEDMIKIIKAQEREIFRLSCKNFPPLIRLRRSPRLRPNDERAARSESGERKTPAADLRSRGAGRHRGMQGEAAETCALVKYQLDPDKLQKVKFSDDVRIPMNQLRLLFKKIDEDYVL